MPGRKRSTGGTPGVPDLTGFQSTGHGERSRLEETAAAAPPGSQGPQPQPQSSEPSAPGQRPQSLPFEHPMFDTEGNVRPGQNPGPAQPLVKDDPDLILKLLYQKFPHPDILNLLEGRSKARHRNLQTPRRRRPHGSMDPAQESFEDVQPFPGEDFEAPVSQEDVEEFGIEAEPLIFDEVEEETPPAAAEEEEDA